MNTLGNICGVQADPSLEKAIDLLDRMDKLLTESSYETWAPNVKTFRKAFNEVMGKAPYEYKKSTDIGLYVN